MTKIVRVIAPESQASESPLVDVVFVHGLDGDARKSWSGPVAGSFWPEWLARDLPGSAVWSVGYAARSMGWRGRAMPILDRAVNVMAALQNQGVGERPLVFVAHSMGGLLVKQILLHSAESHTEFSAVARGVVFLGTPHVGSDMAGIATALGIAYRATVAVKDLKRNSAYLRDLNDRYRDWAQSSGLGNLVFFETQRTRGVLIVDQGSANPGLAGVRAIPVDANHSEICKPVDRDSLVYGQVRRFLIGILESEGPRSKVLGADVAAAPSVALVARAVGRLVETARQQRRAASEAAEAWRRMREEAQRRFPRAWDAVTGELLPPGEPPVVQTAPFREQLKSALRQAELTLQPLIAALVAELHGVRATAEHLRPWCDWVERAAADVSAASGRWPGPAPLPDDETVAGAIDELTRASSALSAACQGRPGEAPPEPPAPDPEPVEQESTRRTRVHRETLDAARPWARVDERPYDAEIYVGVLGTAGVALDLPRLPSHLGIDLPATASLAARVARNADNGTFDELIEDAAIQHPVAIAVTFLDELARTAAETERPTLEHKARGKITDLLRTTDWAEPAIWVDNLYHVRWLLNVASSILSDATVRTSLTEALRERPHHLLEPMLAGISQQYQRLDSGNWSRSLGIGFYIDEVPAWFPITEVAAEIRRRFPEIQPASRREIDAAGYDIRALAAQLLHCESASGNDVRDQE